MKKKILFVISNLKVGGGAEKSVTLLAKGLSAWYDVEILTFYDFGDEYDCPVDRHSFGYEYSDRLPVKAYRLLVRFPRLIAAFLKKHKYDLVVSNAEDANIACLLAKKYLDDYPLWTVIRNNIFTGKHPYRLFTRLHKGADKRIALTKTLARNMPYPATAIPNALDLEDIKDKWDEPISEKELFDKKTIVMIGRLAPQKNHVWFFDVFKELKDVNLLVIGSGPLEKELKKTAPKGVYFLGVKNNVYPYLRKADVFVLPSLFEGMPRALMEALACGAICVANDCETGPRELLGVGLEDEIKQYTKTKYGYLVPFNNKQEFLKAMKDALQAKKKPEPDERYRLEKIVKKWRDEIETKS